jgi:hypothetical protein
MLIVMGKIQDKSVLKSQPPNLRINCEEHIYSFRRERSSTPIYVGLLCFFLFINKSQHQHIHEITILQVKVKHLLQKLKLALDVT